MVPSRLPRWALALTLPGLLWPITAQAEPATGPSAEQIAQVNERRATFPGPALVQSVDWYRPLIAVPGQPRPIPTGKPLAASLASQLDDFAARTGSFALIVAERGRIVYERYDPRFTAASRYDTASMHKAVVALLIGAAVADGHIKGPDDKLSRYLPELAGDARGAITLRQLLEMNSGLRTPPMSDSSASPYWQTYFGSDLRWSIRQWPFEAATRGQFYYANANTQYLLWAIERATGKTYADYLSERLWRRLGASEARLWLDREGGSARGFCCLQASARDWLRIGELIRNTGKWRGARIVPASWVAQMLAPSPANANFGWNIWRGSPYNPRRTYGPGIPAVVEARAPFASPDTYFIDGSGGQRVYVMPSEELVIVRIGTPRPDWDDSYLPNMLVQLLTLPVSESGPAQ
jgi:CubicO group peptidase (beta-lactamase class C family)